MKHPSVFTSVTAAGKIDSNFSFPGSPKMEQALEKEH